MQGKGSEFVGLHMKAVLAGQSFTVSTRWLILGGAIPLQSAKLQLVKASNTENRKCGHYIIASFSLEIWV